MAKKSVIRSVEILVIIALTGTLFSAVLWGRVLADPDAFYHAKMALLIRSQGIVQTFPWLPFTELGRHFADQHFIYHLLLIPFVSFPDPLVGLKIATVVFAIAFFVTFYLVARRCNLSGAFAGTILLLLSSPFTFRLALAKGNTFSLILLFIALESIFHYRPKRLAVITFIYVWSYGGFLLVLAACGAFLIAALIGDAIAKRHHLAGALTRLFPLTREPGLVHAPHALRLLAAAGVGMLAGLVINPFFPQNLPFLYNQVVRIGIVNYHKIIGVGGEWYPYRPLELFSNSIVLVVPLLLALLSLLWTAKQQSRRSWALLLLTALLAIMTLKSRRYVEYFIPLGFFFTLSVFTDSLRGQSFGGLVLQKARQVVSRWRSLFVSLALLVYVIVIFPTVATRDLLGEWRDLHKGFQQTQYQRASAWLAAHASPGDIVVHSDWDEFPLLFYFNSKNYYLAGLDATFLYTADRERYWIWEKISTGTYHDPLGPGLAKLNARYLFADARHQAMNDLVRNNSAVRQVYTDDEATVYAVN